MNPPLSSRLIFNFFLTNIINSPSFSLAALKWTQKQALIKTGKVNPALSSLLRRKKDSCNKINKEVNRLLWSTESALGFVDEINMIIYDNEAELQLDSSRSDKNLHSASFILPIYALSYLSFHTWKYTSMSFDLSKTWVDNDEKVIRVHFRSHYNKQIIAPLFLAQNRQVRRRHGLKERYLARVKAEGECDT